MEYRKTTEKDIELLTDIRLYISLGFRTSGECMVMTLKKER